MKAIINRLETLFRIFEVDDSMPDPQTFSREFYDRVKPVGPAAMGSYAEELKSTGGDLAAYNKVSREVFRRIPILRDPHSGRELWVWSPAEVDWRIYKPGRLP